MSSERRGLRVLSDSPQAGEQHLGPQQWRPVDPGGLTAAEEALWRSLAGEGALWAAAPLELPRGIRLFVVDHAVSSQLEALRDLGRVIATLTPLACLAATGEAFHGQRGRSWEACQGNLHLCVALSPDRTLRELGAGLSMLPAVAVVDCLDSLGGGTPRAGIKWVNDILVDGEKVAGVISASQVRGERIDCAQLGIGLNVARTPAVARDPFVPAAGCLGPSFGGAPLTLARVVPLLLSALVERYLALVRRGPAELLAEYRERSLVLNRAVRVWSEEHPPPAPPTHRGVVEAIEPDLTLRIRGIREPVRRGRLALEEACVKAGL